jgi:DNA repair exonuclease SbcCD nuclease subunit
MKIIQTSNTYFGRRFEDIPAAGNRLRAGIKSIFANIIDTAKNDKADLVILAGDIFDNLDLSQSSLDSFTTEVARLEKTPVVILPGNRDAYKLGSFWDYWRIKNPCGNLFLLAGRKPVRYDFPDLSLAVYGVPADAERTVTAQLESLKRNHSLKFHVGVTCRPIGSRGVEVDAGKSFNLAPFAGFGFNYVAVGGIDEYVEYGGGVKAASAGTPLVLSPRGGKSGGIITVDLSDSGVVVKFKEIHSFDWKTVKISMDSIVNPDDLKGHIMEHAGKNTLLKVELTGLTLLEAGLNLEAIKSELEEHFLDLAFIDHTRVLPQNVSEVKVQEKTVLGQYLKVMVDRMNGADQLERERLEKSLKIGYSLLAGREVW